MNTLASICAALLAATSIALVACDTETPTTAVVDDTYPAIADGGDTTKEMTVFKVWYTTSIFLDAVAPGTSSDPQRIVPNDDYAYALLAPGWDPSSPTPPTTLIPLRSKDKLGVKRGDTLHIAVSNDTFVGSCAAGKPLAQDDADFITQRIFPGDFATVTYDAKTCVSTPLPGDGGTEGGAGDAAIDAPSAE